MPLFTTWSDVFIKSFQQLSSGVIEFLPKLILAIVIFVLGWVVASFVSKVVAQIVRAFKFEAVLRGAGVENFFERAGLGTDAGHFLGILVKWFILLVFLIAAFELLGLNQVNTFLQDVVLGYLPRVIIAVLILLAAAVISDAMKRVVVGTARVADVQTARFLGNITRWAIWTFALLTALFQLGVAAPLVQAIFTGFVTALSLAFGLAFGLGGQQAASDYIKKLRDDMSHRQ